MKNLALSHLVVSVLLFLISAVCNVAVADNSYNNNSLINGKSYHFRNIYNDNLSSPSVKTIIQDKYGFVWIGTPTGIDRYDGKNFFSLKHTPSDTSSIYYGTVTSFLCGDDNDTLWVGTRRGLCFINIKTLKVSKVDLGPYSAIRTLYRGDKNTIWIGTQNGLVKFNETTHKYKAYSTSNSNLSNNIVRAIYNDNSGNLWVGTHDKLNVLKKGSNRFERINLKGDYAPHIQNNLILTIKKHPMQSDSILWIGTGTGLYRFNKYTYEYKAYREDEKNEVLSNNKIVDIVPSGTDKLWVATDFGLNLFDIKKEKSIIFYHNPFDPGTIINNKIWTIFEDDSGIIWIGTDNGISLFDKHSSPFYFFPVSYKMHGQLIGSQINDIIEESPNSFWLATQSGVVRFSTSKGITKELKHNPKSPTSLLASKTLKVYNDDLDRLWIATNKGLNIWDEKNNKMYAFPAVYKPGAGLKSQFVNNIVRAEDGSLWISTWDGGLHRVFGDVTDLSSINIKQLLTKDNYVVSGKDAVWALTSKHLYRIDLVTNEMKSITSFQKMIVEHQFFSIYYSSKGSLWFGCANGLIEYDIRNDKSIFYPQALDRNYDIISILESNNGDIWCCSGINIIKFDIDKKEFEVYSLGENVPVKRFRSGSCCRTSTGELVFAGLDGFMMFNPDKISKSSYQPNVIISELYIRGKKVLPNKKFDDNYILKKDISFTDKITLKYTQRSLMFYFASLHYGNPSGNGFGYKLDGFDDNWNYTIGNDNFAVYSNLPSGKYKLRLKGTNNDGVWSKNESSLDIVIKPPTWASWEFITLYIIVLILLLSAIVYFYHIRFQWFNKLQSLRLEKEHNEKLALSKQRFFINISHEFRTPLSLIIGPVNELLRKEEPDSDKRRLTQLVLKNAERLLRLVNQILDFRKLEVDSAKLNMTKTDIVKFCEKIYELFTGQAEKKGINFVFQSNIEELEVWIDAEKMETAIYNLLSNAFNFTPDNGKIKFKIKQKNDSPDQLLSIKITDSGIGIEQSELEKIFNRFYQSENKNITTKGSGIGLTLVKEFVEMHSGTITVKSIKGKGSVFEIIIPVIRDIIAKDFSDSSSTKDDSDNSVPTLPHEKIDNFNSDSFIEKPTVLIVEDDEEIIEFIKISLKDKYDFFVAENGTIAMQIIEKESVNLIISDVMMPVTDGYKLSRFVKENPKFSHIPLIMLSAKTLTDDQILGIKSGADAYLTKPFDVKYLEAIIENQLNRKELLLEYIRMQSILNPSEIELTSTDEKILKQIITFIETHISAPDLNVKSICKATGYTHSFLYRKVKSLTGDTINELIRDIRIKRAAQLLKTKKFTVAEVMMEVGFTNHSYFSKCFRKTYKSSPGNFLGTEHTP